MYHLKVERFDGKALDPQYVPPKFTGTEPTAEIENAKTYYGGCHCGAVTVAMKIEGLLTDGKQAILECNCSICTRVCGSPFTLHRLLTNSEDLGWHDSHLPP